MGGRGARARDRGGHARVDHREAAADAQHLTGDEARAVAREEDDRVGDLRRLCEASHRDRPLERLAHLLRLIGQERCVGGARAHAVDPDLVPDHLASERLRERDDAALGAGVDGLTGGADSAGVAGDVHDPTRPGGRQRRDQRLREVDRSLQVDLDDAVHEVVGHVDERLDDVPSGDVGEDVEPAELGLDVGGDRTACAAIGDVERDESGGASDPIGGGLAALVVDIGDDDGGAGIGECLCRGPADAGPGAGHERDLVGEVHRWLLWRGSVSDVGRTWRTREVVSRRRRWRLPCPRVTGRFDQPLEAVQSHRVEITRTDRRLYRTARFSIVLAVTEPAVVHQIEDVGERPLDPVARQPQAQRPHTGRVDQPTLLGQRHELGGHGGVATALITLAHGGRGLTLRPDQRVDEGRLADPARTEERQRAVAGGVRPDRFDAISGQTAREQDGHTERDVLERDPARFGVLDQVGLGEHHHRLGAGVEREHELALETPRARWRTERVHEEDDVDVGRQRV